jgi:hypothetical protein
VSHYARIEVPGTFHLVEQRVCHDPHAQMEIGDRELSLATLHASIHRYGIQLCGYNVLSDRVLLALIPARPRTIGLALLNADRTFVGRFNQIHSRVAPFWQHTYNCCPFSDDVAKSVLRYVDVASVRTCDSRPGDGPGLNSADEHGGLLTRGVLTAMPGRLPPTGTWHAWLESSEDKRFVRALEQCLRTGKPFGSFPFVRKVELSCGHRARPACLTLPGLFDGLR